MKAIQPVGGIPADAIRAAGHADAAGVEAFVIEHYSRLLRLAGAITHRVDVAEDSVQSALERAWRHRADLRDPSRLRPWLDQIVAREAVRAAARRSGLIAGLLGTYQAEDEVDLAEPLPDPADVVALRDAYARLSPGHRATVALHLQAGYPVEDTARMLGIPVNTVRSRLRAARKQMRETMAEVGS